MEFKETAMEVPHMCPHCGDDDAWERLYNHIQSDDIIRMVYQCGACEGKWCDVFKRANILPQMKEAK
jgi:hypothetical protein